MLRRLLAFLLCASTASGETQPRIGVLNFTQTTEALNIEVPRSLLLRANRVID